MTYEFPEGFLWGSATSAHQVEGGQRNDWSEWEKENAERLAREAEKQFGHLKNWERIQNSARDPNNYISGRAADHYSRSEEDVALAASLNHTAHRFSIEWSRIEPREGQFDEKAIAHYQGVIDALRAQGIEPFVTLYHWTLPLWVRDVGGWENDEVVGYFVRYAERLFSELPEVRFWITINEPQVYASHAYVKGAWPPQKKSIFAYLRVLTNLAHAHNTTYVVGKKTQPNLQLGIAKHNMDFSGKYRPGGAWWWNRWFLNKIRNYQDFVGLNYYNKWCASETKTDMGWSVCPKGIRNVLVDLKRYEKPVYIVENGLADEDDALRESFIREHLKNIHRAIADGVDVRGYLYWSLLDNFEWDKGFWPRFGLVAIDYETLERTVRPSARAYAEICKHNGF